MGAVEDYEELMLRADQLPWGKEELAMVSHAVDVAAESNDPALEFAARLRLSVSASMANDTECLLNNVGWCLARHDANPEQFSLGLNGDATEDLMWQYKWIPSRLASSSIFSRQQVEETVHDLQRRFELAGLGPSGVLVTRFRVLMYLGEYAEAERVREELARTPRDSHSHCEACTHSELIDFYAAMNRPEEAVAELDAMLAGDATCGEEPERALSQSLLPLLRVGRTDSAKLFHRRGYPMAVRHEGEIDMIAGHLMFLAVTGNTAEAIAVLERHLTWLVHDGLNERSLFEVLGACVVVCDVVSEAGFGGEVISTASDPILTPLLGEHHGSWTVSRFGERALTLAEEIAQRFDARNGNDSYTKRLAEILATAQEHYDIPLEVKPFRPPATASVDPEDSSGWLTRARDLASVGDNDAALAAVARIGDDADPELRESGWETAMWASAGQENWEAAQTALDQRISSLRERGETLRADALNRIGLAVLGRTIEDAEVLRAEIDRLSLDSAPPDLLGMLHGALSDVYRDAGRTTEAADAADLALGLYRRDGSARMVARATGRRLIMALEQGEEASLIAEMAGFLAGQDADHVGKWWALTLLARIDGSEDNYVAGAHKADEAVTVAVAARLREPAADAARLAGHLWLDAAEPREAASRYRYAQQQAELREHRDDEISVELGRALVLAEENDQAIDVLSRVVEPGDSSSAPEVRGQALTWLARAHEGQGSFVEALELWQRSATIFADAEIWDEASSSSARAASLSRGTDDYDEAIALFRQAVEWGQRSDQGAQVTFDALTGMAMTQADRADPSALETIDEAHRLAVATESGWAVADATDSRARIMMQLGQLEEAIAVALQASDLYREADDLGSAGGSEFTAAQVLMHLQRPQEAVGVLRSAMQAPENQPGFLDAARVLLADALDATGDEAGAAELRREVEQG